MITKKPRCQELNRTYKTWEEIKPDISRDQQNFQRKTLFKSTVKSLLICRISDLF